MFGDEPRVTVVRVHPRGGYTVVNAGRDRAPRAPTPLDPAFPTVVAAMRWAARERPGHQIDVAAECETEELLYRAEVAKFSRMLNDARSWYDRRSRALDPIDARDLGDILFPDRVDELSRWLAPETPRDDDS